MGDVVDINGDTPNALLETVIMPFLTDLKAAGEAKGHIDERNAVAAEQNAIAQERIASALERIAHAYERHTRRFALSSDPDVYSGPSRGHGPGGGIIPGGGALGGLGG
jgi:glutathionylspermidine synthase